MPNHREAVANPARRQHLGEEVVEGLRRDDCLRIALGKITVSAIDVAERGRLDDQQLYPVHDGARRLHRFVRPITNYATNCSNCSNYANCSSWASPSRPPGGP